MRLLFIPTSIFFSWFSCTFSLCWFQEKCILFYHGKKVLKKKIWRKKVLKSRCPCAAHACKRNACGLDGALLFSSEETKIPPESIDFCHKLFERCLCFFNIYVCVTVIYDKELMMSINMKNVGVMLQWKFFQRLKMECSFRALTRS